MLTPSGAKWIASNEVRLRAALDRNEPRFHRQELLQKLKRFRQSQPFLEFLHDPSTFRPTLGQLAELMRCRVDADDAVWTKRFEVVRNQALLAQQQDLLDFLIACEVQIQDLVKA